MSTSVHSVSVAIHGFQQASIPENVALDSGSGPSVFHLFPLYRLPDPKLLAASTLSWDLCGEETAAKCVVRCNVHHAVQMSQEGRNNAAFYILPHSTPREGRGNPMSCSGGDALH